MVDKDLRTLTITDLEPNTVYFITAQVYYSSGRSPEVMRKVKTKSLLESPKTPIHVSAESAGPKSARVLWEDQETTVRPDRLFQVRVKNLSARKGNRKPEIVNATITGNSRLSHLLTDLNPYTKYDVSVRQVVQAEL